MLINFFSIFISGGHCLKGGMSFDFEIKPLAYGFLFLALVAILFSRAEQY